MSDNELKPTTPEEREKFKESFNAALNRESTFPRKYRLSQSEQFLLRLIADVERLQAELQAVSNGSSKPSKAYEKLCVEFPQIYKRGKSS